ncbi:MAG TPA: barstar family protein [Syntrophales bacterium]|jgi:ribonuclease inhibitor|nr:barstar family protein [Syntrophales bacterium]HON22705.1 barstar family protein [Syntrophales bacterium]HOU76845.1 barstar family protein [Syntrophales bacterium]HPC31614.1 barstar family protein [Syntrophales bacterium]HQG35313.1 barstar family protein [Syntrophales bacterium]
MPMKRCLLDGNDIHSLSDLYDRLSIGLGLPEHFGRNLDALWDLLSADVEGPFAIVWKQADVSRKLMGRDFERVVQLLQELEQERDDFTLKIEA